MRPGAKRIADPNDRLTEFHGDFELSQLFEFPGKRALKIAIAEKNVAVQQLALEGFRFALAAKVRRAFYEMLAAPERNRLAQRSSRVGQDLRRIVKKRAESGYASDFETIKEPGRVDRRPAGLLEAQGKVAAARVTLNTLIGRSPSVPLSVSGSLDRAGTQPAARSEFLSLAMARNPSCARTRGAGRSGRSHPALDAIRTSAGFRSLVPRSSIQRTNKFTALG